MLINIFKARPMVLVISALVLTILFGAGEPLLSAGGSGDYGVVHPQHIRMTDDPDWSGPAVIQWVEAFQCYGVVWKDTRNGGSKYPLYFTLLSRDGDFVEFQCNGQTYNDAVNQLKIVSPAEPVGSDPAVVWNPEENLLAVVWQEGDPADLFFLTLKLSWVGGKIQVVVSSPNEMIQSSADDSTPYLIWTGTEYALAYFHYRGSMWFARLDSQGNVKGSEVLVYQGSDPRYPTVAWNGTDKFAMVWNYESGSGRRLMAATLDAAGTVTQVKALPFGYYSEWAQIVWMDSSFGFSWQSRITSSKCDLYFALLDENLDYAGAGAVQLTDTPIYSGSHRMVWTGSEIGIAYNESQSDAVSDVYFTRFSIAGDATIQGQQTIQITDGFYNESHAVPTWSNEEYGIVWIDYNIGQNGALEGTEVMFNQIGPLGPCIPAAQRSALIDFYNASGGDGWHNNGGWKNGADFSAAGTEGDWYGVTTGLVNGEVQVLQVNLKYNNLQGNIPTSFYSFEHLRFLNLQGNQLSGGIPAWLGGMTNLIELTLAQNPLGGTIPAELAALTNLKTLNLSNCSLSGSIPGWLGGLTGLEQLVLTNNGLTGSLPAALAGLTNLWNLNLGQNNLDPAPIPNWIGNLSKLRLLQLYQSNFNGTIPPEIGNLVKLTVLKLFNNQLTGEVPVQLMNLSLLNSLRLQGNSGLFTNDPGLTAWLDALNPGWNQ